MAAGNKANFEKEAARQRADVTPTAVAIVGRIIDGDTFAITSDNNRHIRLRGIDTPATSTPEGRAATEGLKNLLKPGDSVRLEIIDTQNNSGPFAERLVALVYKGNTLINEEQVRQGWAVPTSHLFHVPLPEAQRIGDALEDARRNKRGLWRLFPASDFLKPFNLIQDLPDLPEIDHLERFSKIPGATKIGTIWLYVPPTQVTVVDQNANTEFALVRAPGSARAKSSQLEQRIEMYVIFPNRWSINYQFRPLLAQFIRSPFLPIRNEHLEELLLPSFALADDFVANEPTGEAGKKSSEIQRLLQKNADKKGEKIAQQKLSGITPAQFQDTPATVRKPAKIKIRDRQLFCALRNLVVSTVPAKPQSLQVTFILSVFNHLPHTSKVEYLRTTGDVVKQALYFERLAALRFPDGEAKDLDALRQGIQTTTNISDCEPFKKYYRTLLAESNIPEIQDHLVWRRSDTPRLLPFLPERADNLTFRMEYNLFPNEKIASNNISVNDLAQRIDALLLDELVRENLTPFQQLGRSVGAFTGLFVEYFTVYLRDKLKASERVLNDPHSIMIQFGDYIRTGSTQLITHLRQNQLGSSSTAQDVFIAATGRVLSNPDVLKMMKRALRLEAENRLGTKGEMVVKVRTGRQTVLSGLNASYSPLIVPIPVIDHLSPSMQFFGKSDWVISMSLQTCDRALVEQLMEMFQRSRLTRMALEKTDRWYLQKFNAIDVGVLESDANGFFNLLGITRVLIEDFTHDSITGKPGWFTLNLRLVQADLDISDYERLTREKFNATKVPKQILRNIKNKTAISSRTLQRLRFVISRATQQILIMVFQGVTGNKLTDQRLEELTLDETFRNRLLDAAEDPGAWRQTFTDLLDKPGDTLFEGRIPLPLVPGSIPVRVIRQDGEEEGFVDKTIAFSRRVDLARGIFQLAVNNEINRSIAIIAKNGTEDQKREVVGIYDPTSVHDVNGALQRMAFEGEPELQSFNRSAYPDLELPTLSRSPLAIGPDFYYKREERVTTEGIQAVETRLDKLFTIAQRTMGQFADPKTRQALPEEVISDIRTYILWNRYYRAAFPDLAAAKITNKQVSDMVAALQIRDLTEADIQEEIARLDATEYVNVPVDHLLAVRRMGLLLRIAALSDIMTAPEQILGKSTPEDALQRYEKERAELVQQFNVMPQLIQAGLIDGLWGTLTPSNIVNSFALLRRAAQHRLRRAQSEEAAGSMARAYPTVKVYFIEEDAKEWGLLDDYYSYQAIRSVQVVASKDAASRVATIQLSNLTQKLTDSRPVFGEDITHDQSSQEQNLQSFTLREGMTLMIKMGYSNDPVNLERVFMGKIVSVAPGDVIQIVAQSFGAELTSPLFNGQEETLGYTDSVARSLGDVVVQAMSTMEGLEHFGNRNWLEILNLSIKKFKDIPEIQAYSNPKYRKWDYYKALINPINKLLQFGVYDPRLENIYLPFSGNIYSAVTSALFLSLKSFLLSARGGTAAGVAGRLFNRTLWKNLITNATFDWYIPANTSLWAMLREMALYFNDYVVMVLPYNDDMSGHQRETIYVGPKNGLYKYTESFDSTETAKKIFAQNQNSDYMIDIKNPDHLLDADQHPLPGYMPVVSYHWADSQHDIVENAITVSAEAIHNKVTIRFPGEPGTGKSNEFTVVADDNIKEGNIRHLISVQPNIDPAPLEDFYNLIVKGVLNNTATRTAATLASGAVSQFSPFGQQPGRRFAQAVTLSSVDLPAKYMVAANVLTDEMSRMYSGTLKIWGRPTVKPYDVVYLNDQSNQIFGPIEVAEVIHDFNAESGFVTTIVPNAIVGPRDQARLYNDIAMNGMTIPYLNATLTEVPGLVIREFRNQNKRLIANAITSTQMPTATGLSNAPGMIPIAGSALAAASIPVMAGLWSRALGKVMGRDIIHVTGLFQNGVPLVAGLEGAYKDSYRVHFEDWVLSLVTFSAKVDQFRSTLELR